MKRFAAGLCCFLAGVFLCAVNWLGAAAAVPAVQEWSGRRISDAWEYVGYTPLVFGVILLAVAVILVLSAVSGASESEQ
jgi:hypothetical protein